MKEKTGRTREMLEKVDLTLEMTKEEYKERKAELQQEMGRLQRRCKEMGIPVLIVFEGFDAAGKGVQIGELIQSLDPRGFQVYTIKEETEEEKLHPFLWRFWTKTPENGRIAVFDGSWYRKVSGDRFKKKTKEKQISDCFRSVCAFEKQLTDGGAVLVKLFLYIDKKEQKSRFRKLLDSPETAWRVTKDDLEKNRRYEEYLEIMEEMLQRTDTGNAPWTVVEATDKRYATIKIYTVLIRAIQEKIEREELGKKEKRQDACQQISSDLRGKAGEIRLTESILAKTDLTLSCSGELYREKLKKLQKKLKKLHGELYRKRIPLVIVFEGWDAGGKGGAIRRLTEKMDPRGYVVNPTASPNDLEKAHHYLWRFWKAMPKDGHAAIFDRSWYGRVMVERIEGFCTKEEWQRAYKEINDMEKDLTDAGAIVLKFWMQIDKDEQARRFQARQDDPDKRWKITEEDWRNREKWEQYEEAVNEMLIRTSTAYAPWTVVEGNDKYFARIKVLETVTAAIEQRVWKE